MSMASAATTITQAIFEIRDRSLRGESGILEFPCHIAPGSGASRVEVCEKVFEALSLLGIEAEVSFDGQLLEVLI